MLVDIGKMRVLEETNVEQWNKNCRDLVGEIGK